MSLLSFNKVHKIWSIFFNNFYLSYILPDETNLQRRVFKFSPQTFRTASIWKLKNPRWCVTLPSGWLWANLETFLSCTQKRQYLSVPGCWMTTIHKCLFSTVVYFTREGFLQPQVKGKAHPQRRRPLVLEIHSTRCASGPNEPVHP